MKIVLSDILSGIGLSKINDNFRKIEDELNNKVLYRDNPVGQANSINTDVDMNGKALYNLPAPILPSQAARLQDIIDSKTGLNVANLTVFSPYKDIVSTNIQGAIQELKDDVDGAVAGAAASTLATVNSSIASPGYSNGIGFQASGGVAQTVGSKLAQSISISDYKFVSDPDYTLAVGRAIATGAKRIKVSINAPISGPINLASNQIIDFDGGSFIVNAATVAPSGILYGASKTNVKLIDPVINASATSGITGINLIDCPGAVVTDGVLTKCNLVLQASSNTTRMGYKVSGTVISMSGWLNVGCYVSSVNGASLNGVEVFGGKEGVGIYNNCRYIRHSLVNSYSNTQDGFVVIAGQRISYSGCMSYSNGQSGFTTQRQTSGGNTRRISYSNCQAYENVYDGFDLRGGNSASFSVDMLITATSCISTNNTGTGFYVVYAEGTTLTGCEASQNQFANIRIDSSDRTQLVGCRSVSGANAVTSGASKAGIDIYNSNNVAISGCISSNEEGATQDYGISFTGTSTKCQLIGGYYENNTVSPMYVPTGSGNRVFSSQADTLAGSSVFTRGISFLGCYEEEGFGIPTHVRPKGSSFIRTDGGGGEFYISDGAGSWTAH